MAHKTFLWRPVLETPGRGKFRVFSAQMGDGFKQSVGDGLNNLVRSWALTFRDNAPVIEAIEEFLIEHNGALPFLWTPKGREQALWECTEYDLLNQSQNSRGIGVGIWTLSATFTQRFEP